MNNNLLLWRPAILIAAFCLRYVPMFDRAAGNMSLDALVPYCTGVTSAFIKDCGSLMFLNFLAYTSLVIGVLMVLHHFFIKK